MKNLFDSFLVPVLLIIGDGQSISSEGHVRVSTTIRGGCTISNFSLMMPDRAHSPKQPFDQTRPHNCQINKLPFRSATTTSTEIHRWKKTSSAPNVIFSIELHEQAGAFTRALRALDGRDRSLCLKPSSIHPFGHWDRTKACRVTTGVVHKRASSPVLPIWALAT